MKKPIHCNATIEGPKIGRVVAWRKQCRRRVKNLGDRCRWHGGPKGCFTPLTEAELAALPRCATCGGVYPLECPPHRDISSERGPA